MLPNLLLLGIELSLDGGMNQIITKKPLAEIQPGAPIRELLVNRSTVYEGTGLW